MVVGHSAFAIDRLRFSQKPQGLKRQEKQKGSNAALKGRSSTAIA